MNKERTLIILKPDTVIRQLSGQILARFEQAGLKIVAMKMVWASKDQANAHYHLDEEWSKALFEKSKKGSETRGQKFPFTSHVEFGRNIQGMLVTFLTEGPVIAAVLEGLHSVEVVRKLIGSTEPRQSLPGTIRNDFGTLESYAHADVQKRAIKNLVHASDSVANAQREISIWFDESEIHSYKTVTEHYYTTKN